MLLAKENIQKLNHHHPFLHSLTFLDVLGLHSVEQLEEAQLSASYDPDPQKHLANTLTSCKRAFLLFQLSLLGASVVTSHFQFSGKFCHLLNFKGAMKHDSKPAISLR